MAIFLHIGFPKTATTSLQISFRDHVSELAAAGICYPLIDDDFKQRYLRLFDQKGSTPIKNSVREGLSQNLDLLALKIKESGCQDVILSCEELTNFMMMQYDAVNTGRLRDALFEIDKDVRLVVYVRNPSDFYLSILQEKLKRHAGVLSPETFQTNFSKTIRHYETVFGCKAIVREFHPTKLIESDIVADFLDATGLARVDISNWESVVSNESISPEILLALDLARREEGEVDLHYDFDESEMLWRKTNAIAKELSFSNKPVLFKHVHDRIMESNREDIQTLSERHGISFAQGKFVEGQPSTPKEYQISLIEDLMAVDRQRAIYVWSIFTLRAIKSVFSLRKKVHAQTKFKKV